MDPWPWGGQGGHPCPAGSAPQDKVLTPRLTGHIGSKRDPRRRASGTVGAEQVGGAGVKSLHAQPLGVTSGHEVYAAMYGCAERFSDVPGPGRGAKPAEPTTSPLVTGGYGTHSFRCHDGPLGNKLPFLRCRQPLNDSSCREGMGLSASPPPAPSLCPALRVPLPTLALRVLGQGRGQTFPGSDLVMPALPRTLVGQLIQGIPPSRGGLGPSAESRVPQGQRRGATGEHQHFGPNRLGSCCCRTRDLRHLLVQKHQGRRGRSAVRGGPCVCFLDLLQQTTTNRGAYGNGNLFFLGSEGQKSEIRLSAGLWPLRWRPGRTLLAPSSFLGPERPSACGGITPRSASLLTGPSPPLALGLTSLSAFIL